MGTSHRHHATVAGEPNWGKTSSAVSYLGKAVGEGKELDNNPPLNLNPKAIKRKHFKQIINKCTVCTTKIHKIISFNLV